MEVWIYWVCSISGTTDCHEITTSNYVSHFTGSLGRGMQGYWGWAQRQQLQGRGFESPLCCMRDLRALQWLQCQLYN